MQEFVCDKGHRFIFTMTFTAETARTDVEKDIETYQKCPVCLSKVISVAPEENITSVKSVPLEEVDTYLKQGYKVKELYAKNATLVLTEAPKQ